MLNETVQELVGLLRAQGERDKAKGALTALVALDQNIEFLDTSLRQVLSERDELADEIVGLRGQRSQSAEAADDPKLNETTRLQLRGFISNLKLKIAAREERLAHLDTRVKELRETLVLRKQRRLQLEQENPPGGGRKPER